MAVHTSDRRPRTNSERSLASQARAIAAGGVRVSTILPPGTVAALDALIAAGYAPNRMAAMRRAIQDAAQSAARQNPASDA